MNDIQSGPNGAPDDADPVLQALQRAAQVARVRAWRHGHGVIIWRDGRIVEEAVPSPSAQRHLMPWDSWFEGPVVSDDFMADRDQPLDQEREDLESMHSPLFLHDPVALLTDTPARHVETDAPLLLRRGQVGTIVMAYDQDNYAVEFADAQGRTYAMLAITADNLMRLRDTPDAVAP